MNEVSHSPIEHLETSQIIAMQFEAKLTPDGLMTLVAGLIAFAAVIIQIRSSSKQLRDQLATQRAADDAERERQKRAIASAILFEIENFYRYYLRDRPKYFESVDPDNGPLLALKPVGPKGFAVYKSSAGDLGKLDAAVVAAVVQFYGGAEAYLSAIQTYATGVERVHGEENASLEEQTARELLRNLKQVYPRFIGLTWVACHLLCQVADFRFEKLTVGRDYPNPPSGTHLDE